MGNSCYPVENFSDLSFYCERLKSYYNLNNLLLWSYKNNWWLTCLHNDETITLGYTISPNFIEELKKLNKIIPELSDVEYRIQYALGTVKGRYYKIL